MLEGEECDVYIFGHNALTFGYACKIGISNNCGYRLLQVRAHNPEDVKLHFFFRFRSRDIAREVEQKFHQIMEGSAIRNEWFGLLFEEALFILTLVVVRVLSRHYDQPALAIARRDCGLPQAFKILDQLPDEFQTAWNETWEELTADGELA